MKHEFDDFWAVMVFIAVSTGVTSIIMLSVLIFGTTNLETNGHWQEFNCTNETIEVCIVNCVNFNNKYEMRNQAFVIDSDESRLLCDTFFDYKYPVICKGVSENVSKGNQTCQHYWVKNEK